MMRLLYAIESLSLSIAELEEENDSLRGVLLATSVLLSECDDVNARAAGAALGALRVRREQSAVHGEHQGALADVQEWIAIQGGLDGALRRLTDWEEAQNVRQMARRQLEVSFKLEHLREPGDRTA